MIAQIGDRPKGDVMVRLVRKYLALRDRAHFGLTDIEIRGRVSTIHSSRAKDIAKRLTRGNVSIQLGDYEMAHEVDAAFGVAPWRLGRFS